jgi:oxygen-dependent protoporphyrinogen oxidase
MTTIAVIGGGITGLSTMHYLQKIKKEKGLDLNLILVEKNDYLGGKIHTVYTGEYAIETGADSIVARHESVMPLIKDLKLENEVAYNATGISYIYTNNELHPIPKDSVFGIPASEESLYSSTLVSEEGKLAARKDFESENQYFTKESSIGEFLEYFLGKELVEKQIAPVLSGVYSGDLYKLTLASTLPYLLDYKNEYGSIIKGLEMNREKFLAASNKRFLSFNGGLSTLITKLEEELIEVEIIKGIQTTKVVKDSSGYEIHFSNHTKINADFVVLATPHHVAQGLLEDGELNNEFTKLKTSSLISVYLGFDVPDGVLPADGTGFIVSNQNSLRCDASTWTSRKWAHTSMEGNLLVRLFYKSSNPSYESLKEMDEQELLEVALSDIEKSIGINQQPKVVEITNWKDLMPNYDLEHSKTVKALSQKISSDLPNLIIAGCSYYGVGIGACIKNGRDTADKIAKKITEI